MNFFYAVLFLFFVIELGSCHNKYSKEANKPKDDNNDMPTMRDLNKPFRMQKINLLWEKAKIVSKYIHVEVGLILMCTHSV